MHRAMWCSVTPRKNALAHNHKNQSMSPHVHAASGSGWFPISLLLALLLTEFLYLRGWLRLRSASVKLIPAWRVISFSLGLFLIWMAVASPLAALDELMLTVHMIQHLLLMTFAAPLMLLGLPVTPFLQGLPNQFAESVVGPLFRCPPTQRLGRMLVRPTFSWLAATATLVGWHVPAIFTLALQSGAWHLFQQATFLVAGLLFWWPVVQPWPNAPREPRWPILLYLFLATLPCDILSAFLVFSERVVYPVYLSSSRQYLSVLTDQQCAGALMWTCITIVYLVPAAILSTRLLAPRDSRADLAQSEFLAIVTPQSNPKRVEAL
jgi:cytochrome c oxidase assembly factor CtaG